MPEDPNFSIRDAKYLHNGAFRHTVSTGGLRPENSHSETFPVDPIDTCDGDSNHENRGVQTSYHMKSDIKCLIPV